MSRKQPGLTKRTCQIIAWGLALAISVLAIVAWGDYYTWRVWPFSIYVWFPVFGLLAFSLMWTHYMVSALCRLTGAKELTVQQYFSITGWAVLILICLHPGLLIYQRFVDGYGLPPGSYMSYVAPGLGWVALLGTASWFVFIAYEFRRVFGQYRWWHYVQNAGDAAMLAIVYHGLRLGTQLTHGWFRWVWLFYAVTLVAVLVRKYIRMARRHFMTNT